MSPLGRRAPLPSVSPQLWRGNFQAPRERQKGRESTEVPTLQGDPESHVPSRGSLQARMLQRPEPKSTVSRHPLLVLMELLEHTVLLCGNNEIPDLTIHRPGRADSHKPACARQKRDAQKLGRICTSGCFVPQRRDSAQGSKTNALDSGFFRTSTIYSTSPMPLFCHLQWGRAHLFLSPMHGRCSGQCR